NNKNWTINELHQKNADLTKAQAEIKGQKRLKDRLFAIVSHDLRGPIGTFAGLSKAGTSLLEAKKYEQLAQIIHEIGKSASEVSTLLDNLLSWASQELKEIPYNPEQIDVNQLVQQLMTMFEPMGRAKSIALVNKVAEDTAIWADLNCTATILRNLLQNAIKFTQEKGQISVSASRVDDFVGIKVSDTGVGMEKDKVKRLFEFSGKSVSYGTAGEKGVGLGLRLVHEFTKINQGDVKVDSVQGGGTSFTVFLPISTA
ncbi:MAG: HAMP domain-containing sensor histidine kinase, partial [Bacteroidota bacterium]